MHFKPDEEENPTPLLAAVTGIIGKPTKFSLSTRGLLAAQIPNLFNSRKPSFVERLFKSNARPEDILGRDGTANRHFGGHEGLADDMSPNCHLTR